MQWQGLHLPCFHKTPGTSFPILLCFAALDSLFSLCHLGVSELAGRLKSCVWTPSSSVATQMDVLISVAKCFQSYHQPCCRSACGCLRSFPRQQQKLEWRACFSFWHLLHARARMSMLSAVPENSAACHALAKFTSTFLLLSPVLVPTSLPQLTRWQHLAELIPAPSSQEPLHSASPTSHSLVCGFLLMSRALSRLTYLLTHLPSSLPIQTAPPFQLFRWNALGSPFTPFFSLTQSIISMSH